MKAGNAAGGKAITLLQRIAEKAISDPGCQFTRLFHLMNVELLMGCFEGLFCQPVLVLKAQQQNS